MGKIYTNTDKIQFSDLPPFVKEMVTELINDQNFYKVTYEGHLPIDYIYVIIDKKYLFKKFKNPTIVLSTLAYGDESELPILPHNGLLIGAHITDHDYSNNRIRMNTMQQVNKCIIKTTPPEDCTDKRIYLGHYTD